jgi:hypothetical protein
MHISMSFPSHIDGTSNSASSTHRAVSNRRPGLRLQNTCRLTTFVVSGSEAFLTASRACSGGKLRKIRLAEERASRMPCLKVGPPVMRQFQPAFRVPSTTVGRLTRFSKAWTGEPPNHSPVRSLLRILYHFSLLYSKIAYSSEIASNWAGALTNRCRTSFASWSHSQGDSGSASKTPLPRVSKRETYVEAVFYSPIFVRTRILLIAVVTLSPL